MTPFPQIIFKHFANIKMISSLQPCQVRDEMRRTLANSQLHPKAIRGQKKKPSQQLGLGYFRIFRNHICVCNLGDQPTVTELITVTGTLICT